MRIGHGYDVHKLVENRKLILGGVHIPYEKGLLGHSDADVLAHAIADALLGAATLGDIGVLFPDDDPQYAGADSLKLLAVAVAAVRRKGFGIENIDATILAQRPKLRPYIDEMRRNIGIRLQPRPRLCEHQGDDGGGPRLYRPRRGYCSACGVPAEINLHCFESFASAGLFFAPIPGLSHILF